MGMGPVPATRKALARAGLSVDDLDVVEINEAFGSQAVACIKELRIPREVVNIDGGALALGHPLGATGARITGKAAQILSRSGGRSEEHTSELQSLMRISYAVFCLKNKNNT